MTHIAGVGNDRIRSYAPFLPPLHHFRMGGSSISGLAFPEAGTAGFTEEWDNIAIISNLSTRSLQCISIQRNSDGAVVSELKEDLLTSTDSRFYPVDIEFGPDGCLYIADFYYHHVNRGEVQTETLNQERTRGSIWRIRHQSQLPAPIPNFAKFSNNNMIQHLTKGKTLWEKLATWHQIVDRKASELLPQLETIVLDNNNSKDILALWSIEGLKSYNSSVVKKLIADKDSDIRREAIHSLASFEAPLDDIVKFLKPCISDSHCMVRSQVLRTLDEIKSANNQTIALLIQAIKPAAPDNKLGGNYESNFERFLVRKALERYPKELQVFLNSKKVKAYLKKSIEWSKLSLPSINYIE